MTNTEWKNSQKGEIDIDLSKYSESILYILENAITLCAENSYAHLTLITLLLPVFALRDHDEYKVPADIARVKKILCNYLKNGMDIILCLTALKQSQQTTRADFNPAARNYWSDGAVDVITQIDNDDGLFKFVIEVLQKIIDENAFEYEILNDMLYITDIQKALSTPSANVAFFDNNGDVKDVSLSVKSILQTALKTAENTGKMEILPTHLLYAVLKESGGYAETVINRLSGVEVTPAKSFSVLKSYIFNNCETDGISTSLTVNKNCFAKQTISILNKSAEIAADNGENYADERRLLGAILSSPDAGVKMILTKQLKWPLDEMHSIIERTKWNPLAAPLPVELCESKNLSLDNHTDFIMRKDITDPIIETLFNPCNHNAAICGERGVGKSAIGYLIAKVLNESSSSMLKETPVIYLDFDGVDSSGIPAIFTFMEEHPRPVYIIDNIEASVKELISICSRRLSKNNFKPVFIMDNATKKMFEEYNGGDIKLEYTEIHELTSKSSDKNQLILKIIESKIPVMKHKYNIEFAPRAAEFAMKMSVDYMLSKRLPQKAVELLESVASRISTRTAISGTEEKNKKKTVIGKQELAESIAKETGLPVETILGTGQDKDFKYLLSQGLVGQENAISKAADRLDLIQKRMVKPNLPAAIFLFAGLSGTGKTELAKQIASIYSTSHKIITYEMNSFKESHSTSRIIGTPPGYVGYEEGGKLINDLNKDPYSLVLFDEVEKANPSIWDPLMRLFDEGIVEDTRGVTAYGNKAFFVLTSNIGQYTISDMLRQGCPLDEIENAVQAEILDAYHMESKQKCFRPEFVARIMQCGGIVVFNALSREALSGIARRIARNAEASFESTLDCKLAIDDNVIKYISDKQFEINDASIKNRGKYLGARPLQPMFDEMVMTKLAKNIRTFTNAKMIRVVMDGNTTALYPVTDETGVNEVLERNRTVLIDRVTGRLSRISLIETEDIARLSNDKLTRLDAILSEVGMISQA